MIARRQTVPIAMLFALCALAPAASAQGDDDPFPWMTSCKAHVTKLGAADDETAHGYCACIDNAMGDEEINDVAGWEKANPSKVAECKAAAEWK